MFCVIIYDVNLFLNEGLSSLSSLKLSFNLLVYGMSSYDSKWPLSKISSKISSFLNLNLFLCLLQTKKIIPAMMATVNKIMIRRTFLSPLRSSYYFFLSSSSLAISFLYFYFNSSDLFSASSICHCLSSAYYFNSVAILIYSFNKFAFSSFSFLSFSASFYFSIKASKVCFSLAILFSSF